MAISNLGFSGVIFQNHPQCGAVPLPIGAMKLAKFDNSYEGRRNMPVQETPQNLYSADILTIGDGELQGRYLLLQNDTKKQKIKALPIGETKVFSYDQLEKVDYDVKENLNVMKGYHCGWHRGEPGIQEVW